MGDSSQGWLKLNLSVWKPGYLSLSFSVMSCAIRKRGGVWRGPSAHYPVNLQALYITASAWQVLEHYKLSWQTLCVRLLSFSLPPSYICERKKHREEMRERNHNFLCLSFSLCLSVFHTLWFYERALSRGAFS